MDNTAKPVVVCDSTGCSVGLFGLLAILSESADFFRRVLRMNDGRDIVGGILSDHSETAHFRECVAKWLPLEPEFPPSAADRLSRCLEEAAGQVTEDEQRELMDRYGKSVELAGRFAPTFCEIVAGLGHDYRDHCEQTFAPSDREKFVSTLLRCDFDLLSSEVSRELRWLGKRLLEQPSDAEKSEPPKSGVMQEGVRLCPESPPETAHPSHANTREIGEGGVGHTIKALQGTLRDLANARTTCEAVESVTSKRKGNFLDETRMAAIRVVKRALATSQPVTTDQTPLSRNLPTCPADLEPTNAAELLRWEIAKRIAPSLGPLPPSDEHSTAMTRFLKPFSRSPHHRTVWEYYNKLRKIEADDLPRWEAEAKAAGLTLSDFIDKLALPRMERFIALNGIPLPPEPSETKTPDVRADDDANKTTQPHSARNEQPRESVKAILNGPVPPNKLRWNGRDYELESKPFRLLEFMWDRQQTQAGFAADHVWEPNHDWTPKALRNHVSKVNAVLLEANIGWTLSFAKGFISKI